MSCIQNPTEVKVQQNVLKFSKLRLMHQCVSSNLQPVVVALDELLNYYCRYFSRAPPKGQ